MSGLVWQTWEDDVLREYYEFYTAKWISWALLHKYDRDRTPQAVHKRAAELKLQKLPSRKKSA